MFVCLGFLKIVEQGLKKVKNKNIWQFAKYFIKKTLWSSKTACLKSKTTKHQQQATTGAAHNTYSSWVRDPDGQY